LLLGSRGGFQNRGGASSAAGPRGGQAARGATPLGLGRPNFNQQQ